MLGLSTVIDTGTRIKRSTENISVSAWRTKRKPGGSSFKPWEGFRTSQAAAQFGIDIFEYYTTGKIIEAEQYHHIEEIVEAWHRRLDRDNVIGLSEANHRRIHKEYDRGYMAKKKMQQTLYDMLQRFRREFGDSGGI